MKAKPSQGFGERLRLIRQSLGKTQAQMEPLVEIGRGSWQALERRGNPPKQHLVARLAAMGFSPEWILTGRGPMQRQEIPVYGYLLTGSPAQKELGQMISSLEFILEEGPISPTDVVYDPQIRAIRQGIQRAAFDPALSAPDRALASLILRSAFPNVGAQTHHEETSPTTAAAAVLAEKKSLEDGLAKVGFDPSPGLREVLHAILVAYRFSAEGRSIEPQDLEALLRAIQGEIRGP